MKTKTLISLKTMKHSLSNISNWILIRRGISEGNNIRYSNLSKMKYHKDKDFRIDCYTCGNEASGIYFCDMHDDDILSFCSKNHFDKHLQNAHELN
ncbi:MAG: hypothetical protein RLZZ210_907 [Pseudomonadota bacterium]|jgi:hypothetical protein